MRFQPGDHTTLTYDRKNPSRTELILPVTVVEDSPERTMVYVAANTPTKTLLLPDGSIPPRDVSYKELAAMERSMGESRWLHTNMLLCWQPDWTWDVRLMWNAETWGFRCWYVNIQDRVRSTDFGFSTTDHFVDLLGTKDGQWTLKDEAELEDAIALGMYSADEAAAIRDSVQFALDHIERRAWPLNENLQEFRPPPHWQIPPPPRVSRNPVS